MMIFLLSLAGIPPLAGFFGKFYLFSAVLGTTQQPFGLLWLVVLALALSAVSLYYYLQVLKRIYVVEAAAASAEISTVSQVTLVLVAIAVVALGCAPEWLIAKLGAAVTLAGH
jgi:NADH-quinone oxidoreductase subunit N